MLDINQARKVAEMANAIGEPTRLHIIELLASESLNVTELAQAVGVPMVNMSHHLGVMRQAGLVEDERQGRKKQYSLAANVYKAGTNGSLGTIKLGNWELTLVGTPGGSKKRKK